MASDASLRSVDELKEFENALRRYQESLVQSTNDVVRAMNTINQGWNDKVQIEFMQRFSEALKGIKEMTILVDDRRKSVHKTIEILEAYSNMR